MDTIKLSIFTDLSLVGLRIQSLYEGFVKFCFRLLTFLNLYGSSQPCFFKAILLNRQQSGYDSAL
jgi:hypothetical protein